MTSGLAQHCHHDKLFEFCYNLEERQRVIRDAKPPEEQALRLRLLKIYPLDRLPVAFDKLIAQEVKLIEKYRPELEALHTELCPDCPFDGYTIFARKNESGDWY